MRERKGVDPEGRGGGEELRGGGGVETIIRVCCVRKEYIFNKRKKENIYMGNSSGLEELEAQTPPFIVPQAPENF